MLGEDVERVVGQDAFGPERTFKAGVAATLFGQITGGLDGVVADRFHRLVGEGDSLVRAIGDVLQVQCVLEAHDAKADWAVLEVGVLGLRYRVVIDVDDVIEHAHGSVDGTLQLGLIQLAIGNVMHQVDGAQVTHGDFVSAGVQRDLGAQIGAVDHTSVLLRAAQVAGIFKGQPGVAGFEQHAEHLAPQIGRLEGLVQLDLAVLDQRFVILVTLFKGLAGQVVQIGYVGR